MFSAYALFGILSFVWPTILGKIWLNLSHLAGLALDFLLLYCLMKRKFWALLLVPAFSFAMILHLLVFIFSPLSVAIAYIGPSRSFYTLFITVLAKAGAEEYSAVSMTGFNAAMVLFHTVNLMVFIFSRQITGAFKNKNAVIV